MEGLVQYQGKLSKYTNVVKGWQTRYFILNPQNGFLDYHVSESEAFGSNYRPRGSLPLDGAVIAPSSEDSLAFSVNSSSGEVYKLKAADVKGRQEWITRLRAVSEHYTSQIAQEHPPLATKPRTRSVVSNITHWLLTEHYIKDHVQQLSSNQPPATTPRPHPEPGDSPPSRGRSLSRGSLTRNVGEVPTATKRYFNSSDLKQLQDARESIISVDNYHAGLVNMAAMFDLNGPMSLDRDVLLLKATSNATIQALTTCHHILHKYHQYLISALPHDAEISWVNPKTDAIQPSDDKDYDITMQQTKNAHEQPPLADPALEVEDVYVEPDEGLGAVDEHRNVIMHLLSQLKLGMDLTKVTLPTFILEKRSLLEMYSDFGACTHMLLDICDGDSPVERMHRVLKFYLTSFQSGRRGQTAKKPYNPILGETFQCSYHPIVDGEEHRVQFVAEQVSHHPPISAFFMSCPDKGIKLESSIWTRSKFMNMSVGVMNVGEGILTLTPHNEVYTMTYPSAFARSILTVPWSELGGRCTIVCEGTGMVANIMFHTKPAYGGQPHRVTAEVKDGTGVVTCRVQGKWNGELSFKYTMNPDAGEEDVEGIDTTTLVATTKRVQPLDVQFPTESRRLWRNVTEALRKHDVTTATKYKEGLEEEQRKLESWRGLSGASHQPTFFTKHKGKEVDCYKFKYMMS
uniref:oxysterol-binding protein-related protein 11-like isoform X2 n=1 Tax=Ciona intestinalis TaxID=7719 RepID=UPI000EF521C4|nr:oxysterol-binding protein-related protein 11-like isoform X2 [Ciona intestinalis]|eukprot:XP_026693668.1 oxysterol-binding protein-related protein 11-like isoform X2 [Ciona intestinalis]